MPGISVSKICIPFSGGGGVNWAQYCTPQNVVAAVASDTSIGVTWDSVSGATSYKIYYCTDGVTFGDSITSLTSSGILTGLTADTIYFIRVASLKGTTECDPSAMVMERTDIAAIIGAYYVSPTGSGTTYSYDVPGNFNNAIFAANHENDVIVFKRGTYIYSDGAQLDYNGVKANGVTIRGINRNPARVVLNFNNSGDSGGWLYINETKTSITLRDFTIKNLATSYAINISGDTSGSIEHVYFYDSTKTFIWITGSASQSTWNISRCVFSGIGTTGLAAAANSILIDGSSATVDVNIQYSVFMPSALNHGAGIWMHGAPSAARTVNFYNNEFYGMQQYAIYSGGNNYTGNANNNIFAGCGITGVIGGYKAFEGNWGGYASTVDYNINMGSSQFPAYYDSQITPGAHEINTYALKITKYPIKSWLSVVFDDASGWNSTGRNWLVDKCESKGWKMTSIINVAGWDSVYGGTPPSTELATYIAAGHDVGCHSFSHTPLSVLTGAISIAYSGGGTKSVVIATDVVAGGADWNGIIKDYTQWTGSLTLDAGGTGEDVFNFYENGIFKTLADLEIWIETHAEWAATTHDADYAHISKNTLCIALANVAIDVSTGTDFAMEETPYLWLETKFAKDKLESIILSVSGSNYTVVSWGCPFNLSSLNLMDALMEAGYSIARGQNGLTGVTTAGWDSMNFAKYCCSTREPAVSNEDDLAILDSVKLAKEAILAAGGCVGAVIFHGTQVDHATEQSVISSIFDIWEDFEDRGLNVVSLRELAEYIDDNSMVASGTVGNDLRVKLANVEQFDGTKTIGSIAIDAGVDVSITEDMEYIAVGTPPNIGAYES